MAEKWTIREDVFEGTIFSVGPEKAYSSGQGSLREVVIQTDGMYSEAFVPVTAFGLDAKEAAMNLGSQVKVRARLVARQYEWNGDIRWSLQYTAAGLEIVSRQPSETQKPDKAELPPYDASEDEVVDDMPF